MALHPNLAPDLLKDSGIVDQEGASFNSHILAAVHIFFDPDAKFFANFTGFVGRQRKIQIVLRLELVMSCDSVFRDTDNARVRRGKFLLQVPERFGFLGASGRVVLWIEIDDDRRAFKSG